MTSRKTLRAKSPADLLALVPTVLGFHPDRSVVLLTTGSARVPVHARVDLPGHAGATEETAGIAAHLAEVAERHGVRLAAVVLYSEDAALAAAMGTALVRCLGEAGVGVQLVVRADGERWYLHDPDGAPRRESGAPYDLSTHPVTLRAVVENGRVVHGSRDALVASLDGDEARRAAVQAAVSSRAHGAGARTGSEAEAGWVLGRVRRFLDDGAALPDGEAARVLLGLRSVVVRDAVWSAITRGSSDRQVDLWRDLVRRSPADLLPAPASLLAFAAWLSGDGALAWCAVDRVRKVDPGYRMAALVARALAGGVPPTAWRPPGAVVVPLPRGAGPERL